MVDATHDVCISNHLLMMGADRRRQEAVIAAALRSLAVFSVAVAALAKNTGSNPERDVIELA